MNRAAIVGTLSCVALIAGACTQDFDGLFAKDSENDTTPTGSTSSSGSASASSSSGKPDPIESPACGKPVDACTQSEKKGDKGLSKSCSGCGCDCGEIACPADGISCSVDCRGGSTCKGTCAEHVDCSFTTDGSISTSTCDAETCELTCVNGSTCDLDCSGSESCTVTVDATSTAVVKCSKIDCNVSCAKGEAATCSDGTRACGECPG